MTFSKSHALQLQEELEKAYIRGDERAARYLSVLLMIGNQIALDTILSI
jgi:hypothetical protein